MFFFIYFLLFLFLYIYIYSSETQSVIQADTKVFQTFSEWMGVKLVLIHKLCQRMSTATLARFDFPEFHHRKTAIKFYKSLE